MEELLAFLNIQCARARDLLNGHYKNDSGKSLEDWAKGNLSAYVEVRSFVQRKIKESSYNEPDATPKRPERDKSLK
tara:strand:- start:1257 stop:1484 length:228 start_codon:yes stop_codon:yes gene_type:complete